MGEIKVPLHKLPEGKPYTAGAEDYVINEAHSMADIIRHAIKETSVKEVRYIVDNEVGRCGWYQNAEEYSPLTYITGCGRLVTKVGLLGAIFCPFCGKRIDTTTSEGGIVDE